MSEEIVLTSLKKKNKKSGSLKQWQNKKTSWKYYLTFGCIPYRCYIKLSLTLT